MAKQKTAVIIGGTSGIGLAISQGFATEKYQIVIAGRNHERGILAAQACMNNGAPAAEFISCDVADPVSVDALALTVLQQFGTPQILVNSAGILQSGQYVLDQNLDDDEKMWRINYRGTLVACQIFGRLMKERGAGSILNIGSLASLAPLSLPAYTPGKHAIQALTQILAAELGPHGIRVNSIAPGYTLSDGLKAKISAGERNPDAIKASTALKRFVDPSDIANAALFLCSNKAAAITGVTLPVDAGWLVQAPYSHYLNGNPIRKTSGDDQ